MSLVPGNWQHFSASDKITVEKDGSLSDIKVLRGIGGGADEEAVRALKNSPAWKPGKILDGSTVRVAYTMPIFFKLGAK